MDNNPAPYGGWGARASSCLARVTATGETTRAFPTPAPHTRRITATHRRERATLPDGFSGTSDRYETFSYANRFTRSMFVPSIRMSRVGPSRRGE